jgi:hypothetical protein
MPRSRTRLLATVHSTSPRLCRARDARSRRGARHMGGVQSVLPVVTTRPGWVEVRLALYSGKPEGLLGAGRRRPPHRP